MSRFLPEGRKEGRREWHGSHHFACKWMCCSLTSISLAGQLSSRAPLSQTIKGTGFNWITLHDKSCVSTGLSREKWWMNYKSVCRSSPVVIPRFTLSLCYNELRFKSNEPDISGATLLEESKTLLGCNFLNPSLFYVRTLLTLEVDASTDVGRHLNGTLHNLSRFRSKVWKKWGRLSASLQATNDR